jgi:small subunit ribosomal protein S16
MLAIRMQRTGRSGHAQFRMIVQDSRFSPTRGRVVAYLGSYNPHTKEAVIDGEQASKYLENGAQPSDRAARLLKKEGVKLPDWVKLSDPHKRDVRNPDKRRSTRPAEPEAPAAEPEATADEPAAADTPAAEEPTEAESPEETPSEEQPAAEPEAPAEDAAEPEAPAAEPATEEKPAE